MFMHLCFIIINVSLNPLGFDTQVIPRSWPARNKGCVRPYSYCFIPAFACGERRIASTATGSWRGTNAALLGVFQVTLFCPGPCRTVETEARVWAWSSSRQTIGSGTKGCPHLEISSLEAAEAVHRTRYWQRQLRLTATRYITRQ